MEKDDYTIRKEIAHIQDTLYVLNGKWKLPILFAIHKGIIRFREIQRQLPQITSKVLSKELKELELNKLIERKVDMTYPLTIEYKLTSHAFSLEPLMREMIHWGEKHRQKLRE